MAAAGLLAMRNKAVMFGIIAAAVLRIIFSIFATHLLACGGSPSWAARRCLHRLTFLGAAPSREEEGGEEGEVKEKTLVALRQIVADVSMSLDVLAVAAVARNDITMLVIGLTVDHHDGCARRLRRGC